VYYLSLWILERFLLVLSLEGWPLLPVPVIQKKFTATHTNYRQAQHFVNRKYAYQVRETDALKMAIDAVHELFKAGRVTYLDVITAERDALEAKLILIRIRRESAVAKLALYRALGGGWH